MSTIPTNGNGNGMLLRWVLGVSGSIVVALLLWLFASTVKNTSDIELLKARMYGIEHRKDRSE